MSFCSCVGVFLRAFYFLERKHGGVLNEGNMAGMCSPKIGEPSLATEGYERQLWGMSTNCGVRVPTEGYENRLWGMSTNCGV